MELTKRESKWEVLRKAKLTLTDYSLEIDLGIILAGMILMFWIGAGRPSPLAMLEWFVRLWPIIL